MKLLTYHSVVRTYATVGLTVGTDIVKVDRDGIARGVILVKELTVLFFNVVVTLWGMREMREGR